MSSPCETKASTDSAYSLRNIPAFWVQLCPPPWQSICLNHLEKMSMPLVGQKEDEEFK